jgi:hypothetical protein
MSLGKLENKKVLKDVIILPNENEFAKQFRPGINPTKL